MKKGFTLIELLAVIVILAIIALIATPIILGIIEDARKGSIEASANGYIDAVEYKIARDEIKGTETSSGVYDITELEIDIDGEKPTSGTITINKGNVVDAILVINDKTVYYDGTVAKVIDLYTDKILNGADPIVKGELVPVNIASNGTVTKADITKEWYNYSDKEWANAVILFDNKNYKAGEEIPESNIKEYYVWIPRYAYKLWNVNSNNTDNVEQPIEIKFGSKAKTTGTNNGDMYLHPAFTNFGTQGIWVGKFETSYNEETYTNQDLFLLKNLNHTSATKPSELIIKPNVRSLTYKNVSEFHTLLYNSHRTLNSHMMTNMEWGAAAYLTYSVYGRCDDDSCTEVTMNNISTGYYTSTPQFEGQIEYGASITGCAANTISADPEVNRSSCVNEYKSEKGILASTTGNITGIYDMSGGNWDYVMGVLIDENGKIYTGRSTKLNSGFKGLYGCSDCDADIGVVEKITGHDMPDKKYYNAYINNHDLGTDNWYDYSASLLGDATKEVANIRNNTSNNRGNWFKDMATYHTSISPWVSRGGVWYGQTGAGIFDFQRDTGNAIGTFSARLVLAF